MTPEDELHWPLIDHRLTSLENRVERGFKAIDHKLDTLTFVRTDVYAAEQVALAQWKAGLEAAVEKNERNLFWLFSLIGVAFLGAVVAGIARLAGLS